MTTPIRLTLAKLLAATTRQPSTLEAATEAAAEALSRPDQDGADRLADRLGQVLDAHLGRLEATGAIPADVDLGSSPKVGWPSYRQAFRWLYAATVELARLELAAANVRAEPGAWPAGQAWEDLGGSSRAAFLDLARDRVGIDRGAFLRVVRSGLVELEDLADGTPELPAAREGLVVKLEGEDDRRVVHAVRGATVVLDALEHGKDHPADAVVLQELGRGLASAAVEALDEIAALSGCATWTTGRAWTGPTWTPAPIPTRAPTRSGIFEPARLELEAEAAELGGLVDRLEADRRAPCR